MTTFASWQVRSTQYHAIAQRIDQMGFVRANALFRQAGVGTARNVAHNAMLARASGRPWPEINYSCLRAAIRADAQRSAGYTILHRWQARVWPTVTR